MRTILAAGAALLTPAMANAQAIEAEDRDDIVVTATRSREVLETVPADVTVKSIDVLRRDGFTFGTDEFRGVPGVSFRRGEGDGDEFPYVSIRGSNGTEGYLTLIDGMPFDLNEEGALGIVPYPAVSRVEIVKGPASALYGRGALYGAVNYLTREPGPDRVEMSATGGSDDYYRGELAVSRQLGDTVGLIATAAYEDYGGWRSNGARRQLNLFAKLKWDITPRTTLSLYGTYLDRASQTPSVLPLDAEGRPIDVAGGRRAFLGYGAPRSKVEGGLAALRLEHRASDALTLTATGQARRFDFDNRLNFYDPFGFAPSRDVFGVNGFYGRSKFDVAYGELTARLEAGRHQIVAGVTGESGISRVRTFWSGQNGFTQRCGFTFHLIEIDYRRGLIANAGSPCFVVDNPLASSRLKTTYAAAFAQDEIALSDRLFLTIGGRYDRFRRTARFFPIPGGSRGSQDAGTAAAFSPKASLSWRYGGGQVYASYGRGFASNFGPTFEWDANQYARPEQRPTTLDNYEIGWKGRALDDTLRFALIGFWSVQKNRRAVIANPAAATDFTAPSNLISYGDEYESKGIEASLDIRPRDGTSVTINYTHVAPKWKDYVLETFSGPLDLSGTKPTGVAPNIVHVAAEQRVAPWLSARGVLEWYDDYQITADNRVDGGGYALVTLGARIAPRAWRGLSLDLTLLNALDERYGFFFGGTDTPTYATPGPPRQFRATLRAAL
ncbi:MAG: TonB-dependent receptor [Sphingomonas sp.]